MTKHNDGGPAFPEINCARIENICKSDSQGGMSLWHYFAAHAPLISCATLELERGLDVQKVKANDKFVCRSDLQIIAQHNFDYADYMIAGINKRMRGEG